MATYIVPGKEISIETIENILTSELKLEIPKEFLKKNKKSSKSKKGSLEEPLKNGKYQTPTTKDLSDESKKEIQNNLIITNASGIGKEVPSPVVRIFLFLKIHSLLNKKQFTNFEIVQRLIELFNHNITPIIYEEGFSITTGDIVPNAHLALPLLGLGKVLYQNEKINFNEIPTKHKWAPVELSSNDGNKLLSGNEFSLSLCIFNSLKSIRINKWSDLVSSISYDAFEGDNLFINKTDYSLDNTYGLRATQKEFINNLKGSKILEKPKNHGSDPFCFKGIFQIHGAFKDILNFVKQTINLELQNLTIDFESANFQSVPLAQGLDHLTIAVIQLGNMSERRISYLLAGQRGLPPKLIEESNFNPGYEATHVVATGLVNQNKLFSNPASINLKQFNLGKEEHLIIGAGGALKTIEILNNIEKIFAIELLNAAQALEYRKPYLSSEIICSTIKDFRKSVQETEGSDFMENQIFKTLKFMREKEFN